MKANPLHPDFLHYLEQKDPPLQDLYRDLRAFIFSIYPEANELLYHTHALTSVYAPSIKLGDAFCHIPIYSAHLNLGFNQGKLLDDPQGLLQGTGKVIRHIPLQIPEDYRNEAVAMLIRQALALSEEDMDPKARKTGQVISKIKK
ncbi:MAG: DUF1801 domain-containing protein [Bacteroidota bacterium]